MPAPIGSQSPSFRVSQRPKPETYKIPDAVEGKANETVLFCVGKTGECAKVVTWTVVTLSSEVKFLPLEIVCPPSLTRPSSMRGKTKESES